jgi:hypothetical protein
MQQATFGTTVQSGLPVHRRCALAPAGYSGIYYPFPNGLLSHQCISGELFSNEIGAITGCCTNTVPRSSSGTSLILSRTTHIDPLAASESEACYYGHIFYGD